MSRVIIKNSRFDGIIKLPESKSYAHRALICSCLAGERIETADKSADILATENALDTLLNGGTSVNCGESGSTLRFLIPLAATLDKAITFTGEGRLPSRPIDEYLRLLPEHGAICETGDGFILKISGKLTPGVFELRGDVSSQYISGLLFALPLLGSDSEIKLTSRLESAPYVDMTVNTMERYGVTVIKTENGWRIPGNQSYKKCDYIIESDWSQAAFFLVGGAIGGRVELEGLNTDSLQGDSEIVNVMRRFGAYISQKDGIICAEKSELHAAEINASDIPDAVPALAVLAAYAKGKTVITGAGRLRIKESDRIKSTVSNLKKMGVNAVETADGMIIEGSSPKGAELDGFNDHRIVMAFSVAALYAEGETVITDAQSINKSYPSFFEDYRLLGGKADVICDRE